MKTGMKRHAVCYRAAAAFLLLGLTCGNISAQEEKKSSEQPQTESSSKEEENRNVMLNAASATRHLRYQSSFSQLPLACRRQPEPRGTAENFGDSHHYRKHRIRRQLLHPAGAERLSRHPELQEQPLRHAGVLAQRERRHRP